MRIEQDNSSAKSSGIIVEFPNQVPRTTGSLTTADRPGHIVRMATYADPPGASEFIEKFCQRVKALRQRKWPTQRLAAEALGVSLENWRKYENRTPLPHWLVRRFCLVVDVSIDELYEVDRPLPRIKSQRAG